MARIAFFHNQLRGTDGVSLEVDKWRHVLERRMGHEVFYCAGNVAAGVFQIPELSFEHPRTLKTIRNATVKLTDYASPAAMMADIEDLTAVIRAQLLEFIRRERIEVLVPNNLLSVGYHLAGAKALAQVIAETGLPTISHNHDFWFEASGEVHPTCPEVVALLEQYAPPVLPHVRHLVINRLAQAALRQRKGVEARVVPNVFDFDQAAWQRDDFNADFRTQAGIGTDDIVFLQATRILDRKGVELAIDLVARLQRWFRNRHLVLLCAGYVEQFGISGNYWGNLQAKAAELKVDLRYVGDRVKHERGIRDGRKIYSLWDSYVHADIVTYPSYWEGWGNQFIEAVFARQPVILFEYPVYQSDLKPTGFQVASLGGQLGPRDARGLVTVPTTALEAACETAVQFLTDAGRRKRATDANFAIGKKLFSYDALETILRQLFQEPTP